MAKYCEKYFYPEKYPDGIDCYFNKLDIYQGECKNKDCCLHQLEIDKKDRAILDSLRIVKAQNAEILAYIHGQGKMK